MLRKSLEAEASESTVLRRKSSTSRALVDDWNGTLRSPPSLDTGHLPLCWPLPNDTGAADSRQRFY